MAGYEDTTSCEAVPLVAVDPIVSDSTFGMEVADQRVVTSSVMAGLDSRSESLGYVMASLDSVTSMTFDRAAGNRIIKMIAGSGPPPVT